MKQRNWEIELENEKHDPKKIDFLLVLVFIWWLTAVFIWCVILNPVEIEAQKFLSCENLRSCLYLAINN